MPNFQGNVAVNYTQRETPWICIIEYKCLEFDKDADGNDLPKTVISKEFGGRLRENKYYDMDTVIAAALEMCERELR